MIHLKKTVLSSLLPLLMISASAPVLAAAGDNVVRFGAAVVSPNDSSQGVVPDDAVGVDDGTSVFVSGTHMVTDNLGVELLAAWPFSHDITLKGVGKIAETDQLPPTLSVTYHFVPDANVSPYLGAGINYTTFFNTEPTAVITKLDLEDSWGAAFVAGIDVKMSGKWFFNANVRYIDINTTATTDLGKIDVDINPAVYSIGLGYSF